MATPNASYSITLRLQYPNHVGMFSRIAAAIADAAGDVGAIDIVSVTSREMERDVTINAADEAHASRIVDEVQRVPGVGSSTIRTAPSSAIWAGRSRFTARYQSRR